MKMWNRYRHELYQDILEMNGVTLGQLPPKWAVVLGCILFPWRAVQCYCLSMYDYRSMCLKVDGVKMSMEFLRLLAHGTPEGKWFRTRRCGDYTEIEVSSSPSIGEVVGMQKLWSEKAFGSGPRTAGILKHIALESDEICAAPNDVEEWCDIVILALDGAWRCGATPQEVEAALLAKMKKNRSRVWSQSGGDDQAIEHVR